MHDHIPRGVWVPLITPFSGGAVDHVGLARLVKSFADSGIAGFVVCGSTGEAATLSESEQSSVLQTVSSATSLPLMMGVSGVATHAVRDMMLRWAQESIHSFLVSPPYYVKPSQAGIRDHFLALAEASPLPVVLYDIPGRSGVRIETTTLLELSAHPRIVGVKDCSGDLDHLQAVLNDGRLQVFCGDDHRILQSLCLGASGMIAASAHLHPRRFVELLRLVDESDLNAARGLWRDLWPLTLALFSEPSPGPLKSVLGGFARLASRSAAADDLAICRDDRPGRCAGACRQPPVTGGKNATSAPSCRITSSSHMVWSTAQRTARWRASASAWAASRAARKSRNAPTVVPEGTSMVSLAPSASRNEAK